MHGDKIEYGSIVMLAVFKPLQCANTSCALSELILEQLNRIPYHFTDEES